MAFIKKEFIHIWRDKRSLIVLIGMPIIQMTLFGYAITNEIKNADIAILDKSKDVTSERLVNKVLSSGYFRLDSYLQTDKEIEQKFKEGKIKFALIIEENFERKLQTENKASVQMITDASDPNIANTLVNYITAIVQNFNNELNSTNKPIFNISVETKMRYNPAMRSVYFFVPGLISVILMLISALMTSISITREKELGNMELLLVSPVKSLQVIVAKVLPYTLLAMINAITVLLAGFYVFGVPVLGNVFFLLSECLLYIITSLSLGIFISTKSDTQQAAFMVSLVGLMLPTIVLSGYIFPIENMPLVLQWISNLIPAKWFLIIIRDIMLKGSDITYVWKETLVLAGFAVFFILLSVKNYKERLQ